MCEVTVNWSGDDRDDKREHERIDYAFLRNSSRGSSIKTADVTQSAGPRSENTRVLLVETNPCGPNILGHHELARTQATW